MVNNKRWYNTVQCLIVIVLFRARYQVAKIVHLKQTYQGNGGFQRPNHTKMAKFLKSIFHTTERRKPNHYEHEGDEEKSGDSPQMGSRRQLSISRSGRMRQANKKRHSLTLELYGETIHIDAVEKPQSIEYHVHSQNHSAPAVLEGSNTRFDTAEVEDKHTKEISKEVLNNFETKVNNVKTPEEEIDNAFDVIDKS